MPASFREVVYSMEVFLQSIPLPWRLGLVMGASGLGSWWGSPFVLGLLKTLIRFVLFVIEGLAACLVFPLSRLAQRYRHRGSQLPAGFVTFEAAVQGMVRLVSKGTTKTEVLVNEWRGRTRGRLLAAGLIALPLLVWAIHLEPTAEQRAHQQAAEQARREATERVRRATTEQAQRAALEQARREATEQAQRATLEQARREAAEQAQRATLEQARREAAEQAQREALERVRREAAERVQREALERVQREATEQAQRAALEQARREAAEQAQRETLERVRREAAEQAQRETLEQAQREAKKPQVIPPVLPSATPPMVNSGSSPIERGGAWPSGPGMSPVESVRAYYAALNLHDAPSAAAQRLAGDVQRLRELLKPRPVYTLQKLELVRQTSTSDALVGVELTVTVQGKAAERWCGLVKVVRVDGAWKIETDRGVVKLIKETDRCAPG